MNDKKKEILISAVILILFILAFALSGEGKSLISGGKIEISPNGDTYLNIDIETEDFIHENYELLISKPDISEAQFISLVEEYIPKMIDEMLGESNETEHIKNNLNLFTQYEELPFDFMWFVNDSTFISNSGEIMCAEEFDTSIDLYISYKSYSYDLSIPIHVEPGEDVINRIKKEKEEEKVVDEINARIDAMINSEDHRFITLPTDVNGKEVRYYKSGEKKKYIYLLIGPTAVLILHLAFRNDKRKSEEKELEDIMNEYPTMLQKISLYVASGMSIRNVWTKMCQDAKENKQEEHPLYREMTITLNELNNGVPESVAYLRFGERIKQSEIVRFTALLSQNLKKGSTRLSELLDNEVRNAFVDKKNRAKKQGEKIGTKLLFPMMILLTDTIVIIMVPAFWSI